MVRVPLSAVLALALGCGALYWGALGLGRGRRLLVLVVVCLAILLTPLLMSPDRSIARVLASICAVALCAKAYDAHVGLDRGFRPNFWSYVVYLPNPATLVLRKLDREPRPSRSENLARLAQQGLGFLAGAMTFVGAFQVDWRRWPFMVEHCAKVVAFFLMLVPGTLAATAFWKLVGGRARELMDRPFAARTPADFWKRYNRPAQQFFYEDVFKPLGGRRLPVRATLATFLISGIIHEYVFDIVVDRVQGYQMAFFLIQGIAVAATIRVKPTGTAVIPWVAGTFAFNLATSVVFFASVGEVLPFYARRATG
jgi:hypothetical protein